MVSLWFEGLLQGLPDSVVALGCDVVGMQLLQQVYGPHAYGVNAMCSESEGGSTVAQPSLIMASATLYGLVAGRPPTNCSDVPARVQGAFIQVRAGL